MENRIKKSEGKAIICAIVSMFLIAVSGCETTTSSSTQVTGKVRPAVSDWEVDVYQDPKGLLPWVLDMEIPTKFEQVATMESEGSASSSNPSAVEDATFRIVDDLKKKAGRLGANGIIIRKVDVTEDIQEVRTGGNYESVRYPDGTYRDVYVPERVSYRRVYKVLIAADSVFLDWDQVWTGEPTPSS